MSCSFHLISWSTTTMYSNACFVGNSVAQQDNDVCCIKNCLQYLPIIEYSQLHINYLVLLVMRMISINIKEERCGVAWHFHMQTMIHASQLAIYNKQFFLSRLCLFCNRHNEQLSFRVVLYSVKMSSQDGAWRSNGFTQGNMGGPLLPMSYSKHSTAGHCQDRRMAKKGARLW